MMRARNAALLLLLVLVPGAAIAEDMRVTAQAMGNSDAVLVRVGLSEPNSVAAWGLSVAHRPDSATVDQSTMFGAWGQVSTDIQLLPPQTLGLWAGLTASPFADIDVMYDIDQSRVQIWPGAGVRLAPSKTLSLVARAVYPLGDDGLPSALDLNTITGLFGLAVEF